jgi:hypothetical protein
MSKFIRLYYFIPVLVLTLTYSCKDDGPGADSSILNFKIKEIPATENYLVGALYYSQNDWSDNDYEEPLIGRYGPGQSVSDTTAMEQHIDWAKQYGLNFFIFDFNPTIDSLYILHTDTSTFASLFITRSNIDTIKFAVKFNPGYLGLTSARRMYVNDSIFDKFVNGFKLMIPFFNNPNYLKIDNKYVVYLSGAADITSDSTGNTAVYDELRAQMSAAGYELYIIGEQPRWTPPARYEIRLKNCVDAVTYKDMILTTDYEATLFFAQYVYLNFQYSKDYFATWGADFVPQIQPAFTDLVLNPQSTVFEFPGGEEFFRTYCNVAKANVSGKRLILIDSFNNWIMNTQIEPSVNQGMLNLEIIKDEFKVK